MINGLVEGNKIISYLRLGLLSSTLIAMISMVNTFKCKWKKLQLTANITKYIKYMSIKRAFADSIQK